MTENKEITAHEAFLNAQRAMISPELNKVNPHFKNKYADLSEIISCTRKPLLDNDLYASQPFGYEEGKWGLFTTITYKDGTVVSSSHYPLDENLKAQPKGSEITYARRYTMSASCNIVADMDDDGEVSRKNEWHGPLNKTALSAAMKKLSLAISRCESVDSLEECYGDYDKEIAQAKLDDPVAINGDGEDIEGIRRQYAQRRNVLKQLEQPENI